MALIMLGSDMRATPPSALMSAGIRSRAMTGKRGGEREVRHHLSKGGCMDYSTCPAQGSDGEVCTAPDGGTGRRRHVRGGWSIAVQKWQRWEARGTTSPSPFFNFSPSLRSPGSLSVVGSRARWSHTCAGTGGLRDPRLLGVHDVHDDATLEHLSVPDLPEMPLSVPSARKLLCAHARGVWPGRWRVRGGLAGGRSECVAMMQQTVADGVPATRPGCGHALSFSRLYTRGAMNALLQIHPGSKAVQTARLGGGASTAP